MGVLRGDLMQYVDGVRVAEVLLGRLLRRSSGTQTTLYGRAGVSRVDIPDCTHADS